VPGASIRSALVSVTDIDRSSSFYQDVLDADELMRDDQVVTLGSRRQNTFLLFLRKAPRGPSHPGQQALGLRALIWEVDSTEELDRVESRLNDHGALLGRKTMEDGPVHFVRGHDPDRLPLIFLTYESTRDLPGEHYRGLTELLFGLDR